jgi:cytochrome c5
MKSTSLILAVTLATLLSACGKQESPATEAPAPEAAAPAAPAPEAATPAAAPGAAAPEVKTEVAENDDLGKKVFGNVCSMCHASGAAGAPKFGNKEEWAPRIAQGKDMLYKHALEGFTGAKGMMPARGGSTTLKDEEVKAAVDYMVAKAE